MKLAQISLAALLVCGLGLSLAPEAALGQQRVTMKSGQVFLSGQREDEGVVPLPNLEALTPGDVASRPIWMIPDGLRRVFVGYSNVAGGLADSQPTPFERFTIPQKLANAQVLGNVGPILQRGPFDQYGIRMITMASGDGPVNMMQGVTEINPLYVKAEGLIAGGAIKPIVSNMRFRTNSIPAEELRPIMYRTIDMNDAQQRLRVYKLFFQAGRYADAAHELESIMKQFPDLAELKEQRKSLIQLSAEEFIREIERREEAGQVEDAIYRLQNFPEEEIAGVTLVRVKDKLKVYEDALKQRDEILAALERDLGEISDDGFRKSAEEVVNEIKQTVKFSTIARLADYDRLKDDKTLPTDQRYALAISGWVLGQGFTKARTLSVALSAYETRKLVWRYMKTSIEQGKERAAILRLIEDQEAGTPEFLSRIVLNMLPFGEVPKPVEGAPKGFFELQCRGVTIDAPKVSYLVQLPPEYDPMRYYPTIVALHGQNAPARWQIDWWCGPPNAEGPRPGQATRHGYIVIAPKWSGNGASSYQFSQEEHGAVLNSLRDAMKRFSIDSDRVYLSGLAAGADAAWDIGLSHPDLWAGVLPICPQVNEKAETDRYLSRYKANGRGLPFYFVCGEKDGSPLSLRWGKLVSEYLRTSGYDCTIVQYEGRGLEDYFEEVIEMFKWMEFYRRDFKKKELREFVSMRPTDNFAWCLELDELDQRWIVLPLEWPPPKTFRMGGSEYKITETNDNHISLKSVASRLSICLSPDFVNFEKPIKIFRDKVIMVKQKPSAETLLEDVRTRGDRQHPFWMRVTL
jgi:pimeloyl-ACP methyl ester carboxylesterase